jgi:putative transposase
MGRPLRPVEEGLVYHALNRGNNRTNVFDGPEDHEAFLAALGKTKERYPFRLFGYCLMTNHFHLLLRPDSGQSLSRILQSLTVAHTGRYHRQHRTVGHVWQGRFKSPVIQDDGHLLVVLRYIEANPLRAGMVTELKDYRWSSFPAHAYGVADPLLGPMPELEALGRTPSERHQRWRRRVLSPQRDAELHSVRDSLRTGKPLADPDWITTHAEPLGLNPHPRPRGRPRKAEKMN